MKLSIVVAVADNNAIGIDNKLPWNHIREDMLWFKANTSGKAVVMGSSTWDSLPRKPLPNRTNVVLTSRATVDGANVVLSGTPEEIIAQLQGQDDEVCIIGGAKVYNDFAPYVTRMYITRVHQVVEADTYLDIDTMLSTLGGFTRTHNEFNESAGCTFQIWDKE
jgi:dihydrofolate reductase